MVIHLPPLDSGALHQAAQSEPLLFLGFSKPRSLPVFVLSNSGLTRCFSFCEEDYAVTKYIAEFVNTLSNLAYGMYDLATTNTSFPSCFHVTNFDV